MRQVSWRFTGLVFAQQEGRDMCWTPSKDRSVNNSVKKLAEICEDISTFAQALVDFFERGMFVACIGSYKALGTKEIVHDLDAVLSLGRETHDHDSEVFQVELSDRVVYLCGDKESVRDNARRALADERNRQARRKS